MFGRTFACILLFGAFTAATALAQTQAPAYGMMFQKPQAAQPAQEPTLQLPQLPPLSSRPLTAQDVDNAVTNANAQNARAVRTPTPMDLARMPLPSTPSAEPASFEQQQAARAAAWQAQEERRLEHERQVQAALEAERNKPKVVVVQQQDPFLSNLLAIPRAIGLLFGGGTVR